MSLQAYPEKVALAHLPTEVHPLPRLSQHLGVEVWIKRDDTTGLALGGNKARKLEYLVQDALLCGADTLITAGGPQSNHARMTAAAAAAKGLSCHLVLAGKEFPLQGNLLLDKMFGATLHCLEKGADREAYMEELASTLRRSGKSPYSIGIGGSNALGSLGYVDAMGELCGQVGKDFFSHIYVPVGSGGTLAGLLLGKKRESMTATLKGIAVAKEDYRAAILRIAKEALREYQLTLKEEDIHLDMSWIGEGYGIPSAKGLEAISLLAHLEGILLDPVYTGKAMAALLADSHLKHHRILFWHTGGAMALFAYAQHFV